MEVQQALYQPLARSWPYFTIQIIYHFGHIKPLWMASGKEHFHFIDVIININNKVTLHQREEPGPSLAAPAAYPSD